MPNAEAASDERLIALYLDMLAAERGAAGNTLEAYRRDLAHFAAALAKAKRTIAAADTSDLRAYLAKLSARAHALVRY